jgi:glucose-1-phosphate thymidylyltransferase
VVVVAGEHVPQFEELLQDGKELGVRIAYAHQEGELGIADALAKAEPLVDGDPVVVLLGDNIFQNDLTPYVEAFREQEKGGKILLKEVGIDDARRFGVATVRDGKIVEIEEKPQSPKSSLVVTGCYMYDGRVFDFIRQLVPSGRGELEVTDLNNMFIAEGSMTYDVLTGWWTDAGTPASKLKASILVALQKGVTFHQ